MDVIVLLGEGWWWCYCNDMVWCGYVCGVEG